MVIKDIIDAIEKFAPLEIAESYDNCGLKLGNVNSELKGVLVTLDTNEEVVLEAIEKNCNLIVEHHPTIFRGIKKLDYDLPVVKAMTLAIKNDIAIYSAHTNFDFAEGGLNDYVCSLLDLSEVNRIYEEVSSPRSGVLKEDMTLSEFAEKVRKTFSDDNLLTIGNLDKKIKKVAMTNGGGGGEEDFLLQVYDARCDVFVTGDVKYHVARLCKDINCAIIQVGHYNSEMPFCDLMKKVIVSGTKYNKVFCAEKCVNPYN